MATNAQAQLADGCVISLLRLEHLEWVTAVVGHSMAFDSPIWSVELPDAPTLEELQKMKTKRAYELVQSNRPSAKYCIESGLSYGVFIQNWTPRRADTEGEGQLHWNSNDTSASREQLLEQMDFPLIAITLSQDAAKTQDSAS